MAIINSPKGPVQIPDIKVPDVPKVPQTPNAAPPVPVPRPNEVNQDISFNQPAPQREFVGSRPQEQRPQQQRQQEPRRTPEAAPTQFSTLQVQDSAPVMDRPQVQQAASPTQTQAPSVAAIDSGYAQPAQPTQPVNPVEALVDQIMPALGPQVERTQEVVEERPEPSPMTSATIDTKPLPPETPAGVTTDPQILEDPAPIQISNTGNRKNIEKARVVSAEQQRRKQQSIQVGRRSGNGNAINAVITSDPTLGLREASFGTREMIAAYSQPESALRQIVQQYTPDVDPETFVSNDSYASSVVDQVFNGNNIELLTTKFPTPAETDAHLRVIRVHDGKGARLHPLAFKMFNADADGDTMSVSFNTNEIANTKTAMDYLIGTDNEVKIDSSFFDMLNWGTINDVSSALREILRRKGLTDISVAGLSEAVYKMTQGDPSGYTSMMKWARRLADRPAVAGNKQLFDSLTDSIIKAIYDYNSELWAATTYTTLDNNLYLPLSMTSDQTVNQPAEWSEDLISGSMPANNYDLLNAIGAPVGQVQGKNQQFRMVASLAKRIKPDRRLVVGQDTWKSDTEWTNDAEEQMAKYMSSMVSHGESKFGTATYLRSRLLRTTGVPASSRYGNFKEFVDTFVRNYNYYAKIVTSATNVVKSTGEIYATDKAISPIQYNNRNEDIRTAFKRVYGEYTMGSLFGSDPSIRGFENMSLNDFINSSRTRMISSQGGTTVTGIPAFVRALQDMRTGLFRDFNDLFTTTLTNNAGKIKEALKKSKKNARNYVAELDILTEALYLLGADVFNYFGFDSIEVFRTSDLGMKLINAETSDKLGGVVYEAVGRYRLDALNRYQEEGRPQRVQEELDSLASTSDTWSALVNDFRNGGNAFEAILLSDMGKNEKDVALNNLQKDRPSGNQYQQTFEIAYDIMANPQGLYAGAKQLSNFGQNEIMDNFKASNSKIDAAARENYENIVREVQEAKTKLPTGSLTRFLDRVASNEINLFQVDRQGYVDALYSGMDRTFASSEKSKQEASVSTMFSAVSHARNGGVFSDLAVADDFFLGKMPLDRFLKWPLGMAKILSDPNYSIEVYDGTGSTLISRDTFLEDSSEAALWDFLSQNPRIAMVFRSQTVVGSRDNKSSFLQATNNLYTTIDKANNASAQQVAQEKAFMQLVDHPGFAALVSLTQPLEGISKRQALQPGIRAVDDTIANLREISEYDGYLPAYIEELVDGIIGTNLDRYNGLNENIGEQMRAHLIRNMTQYAQELKELNLPPVENVNDITFYLTDDATVRSYFDTVQIFSGAKTAISTGVNGSESQRNGILAFVASYTPEACDSVEFEILDNEQFRQNWDQYLRRRTEDGLVIDETTWQDILDLSQGEIRIEIPESCTSESGCPCTRHTMADPSTNINDDTQTSPLGRYMLDKRTFGTEALNLKVKTLGDDGSDSITKYSVFDNDIEQLRGDVMGAFNEGGIASARRRLAESLYRRNVELGYDSLNIDDFVNITQMLIRPIDVEGNQTVEIMTIGQLSQIAKQSVHEARLTSPDLSFDEIVDRGVQGIRAYDVHAQIDVDEIVSKMNVVREGRLRTETIERGMSSTERNAQLIETLEESVGEVHSLTEVRRLEELYKNTYPQAVRAGGKLLRKTNDVGRQTSDGYDLLGVIDSTGAAYSNVVGPRTMWIIMADANKASVKEALIAGDRVGATILFSSINDTTREALAETGFINQVNELPGGQFMLPFFDVKLNGPSTIGDEGAFNTGVYSIDQSNIVRLVEDVHNTFKLTDADFQPMSDFVNRVQPREHGRFELDLRSAFATVSEAYPTSELSIDLPSKVDIEAYIVRGTSEPVMIDLGEATIEGDARETKTNEQIMRYIERFNETDDRGWLTRAQPDEIVGWLRGICEEVDAWHPVRMYDINMTGRAPDSFDIEGYGFDQNIDGLSRGRFVVQWKHDEQLLGNTFKLFEGWFSANKLMARSSLPQFMPSRKLKSGMPIDAVVASASTSGRRLTYQIQQSMATLMAEARLVGDGYNFADVEGSFPANPELKEGLSTGALRLGDWKQALAGSDIEFFPSTMPDKIMMDAFANKMARDAIRVGINPSDVFASQYNGVPTNHWFRFNTLFSSSTQFQNNLMRFFNFMDETICPPAIGGDYSNTLFNDKLQMLVPFTDSNGNEILDWAYVYTGLHFLDKHYSGFSSPSVSSSDRSVSIDNTLLYGGRELNPDKLDDYLDWALWDKPIGLSNTWMFAENEEIED